MSISPAKSGALIAVMAYGNSWRLVGAPYPVVYSISLYTRETLPWGSLLLGQQQSSLCLCLLVSSRRPGLAQLRYTVDADTPPQRSRPWVFWGRNKPIWHSAFVNLACKPWQCKQLFGVKCCFSVSEICWPSSLPKCGMNEVPYIFLISCSAPLLQKGDNC